MTSQCKCVGIERCGLDAQCVSCCGDLSAALDDYDAAVRATLEQPYFDAAGNEGTQDEVYS